MNFNIQNDVVNKIKNIINHDDFMSPYDWIGDSTADSKISGLLNGGNLNKTDAVNELMKSYFENYLKRLKKLIDVNAPPSALLSQSEGYFLCIQRLNQILEQNN